MKSLIIILVILALFVGGFLLLGGNRAGDEPGSGNEQPGEQIVLSGTVVAINLEAMAADGPALITIEQQGAGEGGEAQVVAVPSMGLPLCAAAGNITSVSDIAVGDQIEVRGQTDEQGRVVPCEDQSDYLRVMSTVRNSESGFEFSYRKGPDGYIVLEGVESGDTDFVSGIILFYKAEYEEFQQSSEPREGPPSILVRVYKNPEKHSAALWPEQKSRESNIEQIMGEPAETAVAGANAVHYTADGLYPIDTYVVDHDGNIYTLMAMYPDQNSDIYKDFQTIVQSFKFIAAQGQGAE